MTWASRCGDTDWPVFVWTLRSSFLQIKTFRLCPSPKGFLFLFCLSVQVGEGGSELGAYRFSPVPTVWAPSRYKLPPDSQPLERPVCCAVFMPTLPIRRTKVSRPPGSKKGRKARVVAGRTPSFLLEGVHFSLDAKSARRARVRRITLAWLQNRTTGRGVGCLCGGCGAP